MEVGGACEDKGEVGVDGESRDFGKMSVFCVFQQDPLVLTELFY